MGITQILFWILSALALGSALMVITRKNPVHSVLYLVVTFFAISGHYILMNAQFLAIVNIIVYAGAIMVLFLFVIMLMNLNKESDQVIEMKNDGETIKIDVPPLNTILVSPEDKPDNTITNFVTQTQDNNHTKVTNASPKKLTIKIPPLHGKQLPKSTDDKLKEIPKTVKQSLRIRRIELAKKFDITKDSDNRQLKELFSPKKTSILSKRSVQDSFLYHRQTKLLHTNLSEYDRVHTGNKISAIKTKMQTAEEKKVGNNSLRN